MMMDSSKLWKCRTVADHGQWQCEKCAFEYDGDSCHLLNVKQLAHYWLIRALHCDKCKVIVQRVFQWNPWNILCISITSTLWYALNLMSQIYGMESPIDTTQAWTVWASYMSTIKWAYSFAQLSQVCCYGIVTRTHYCGHIWTTIEQSLYLVFLGSISLSLLLFAQSCTVWSCILVSCIPRSPFDCL